MTTTELHNIGDLPRVVNASLGFVLPEFNIAYDFHTLWHFIPVTYRLAFVSTCNQCDYDVVTHVSGHTFCLARRTESTTPSTAKSP